SELTVQLTPRCRRGGAPGIRFRSSNALDAARIGAEKRSTLSGPDPSTAAGCANDSVDKRRQPARQSDPRLSQAPDHIDAGLRSGRLAPPPRPEPGRPIAPTPTRATAPVPRHRSPGSRRRPPVPCAKLERREHRRLTSRFTKQQPPDQMTAATVTLPL